MKKYGFEIYSSINIHKNPTYVHSIYNIFDNTTIDDWKILHSDNILTKNRRIYSLDTMEGLQHKKIRKHISNIHQLAKLIIDAFKERKGTYNDFDHNGTSLLCNFGYCPEHLSHCDTQPNPKLNSH